MFKFFRFILIVLSLAAALLSIFGLIGSYTNKSYLTQTYLINVHLDDLDLSKLLEASDFKASKTKRDWASQIISATGNSDAASAVSDAASAAESYVSGNSDLINQIVQLDYSDLGLSSVYQIGYWGYCKGQVTEKHKSDTFDNSNVNITWCSKPKPGFKFDPLDIFKRELNATLQRDADGTDPISATIRNDIDYLVDNLSYDNLNLPGDLNSKISIFNNLTTASFGLLLAGAVLAIISVVIQLLGCFMSPDSCCLSFLNFLFEVAIFVILFVGSVIVTFTYTYTRGQINDQTEDYGIKSYLSINFYAFIWSGTVAALLCCGFNLLGHCCGLFSTGRKRFRSQHQEPEMAYSHMEMDDELMKSSHHSSYHSSYHSHH